MTLKKTLHKLIYKTTTKKQPTTLHSVDNGWWCVFADRLCQLGPQTYVCECQYPKSVQECKESTWSLLVTLLGFQSNHQQLQPVLQRVVRDTPLVHNRRTEWAIWNYSPCNSNNKHLAPLYPPPHPPKLEHESFQNYRLRERRSKELSTCASWLLLAGSALTHRVFHVPPSNFDLTHMPGTLLSTHGSKS